MRIVCEGEVSQVFLARPDDWHEEHFSTHKWEVLLCPSCDDFNVFEFDEYETEAEPIGEDADGLVFGTPIHTRLIYPLVDLSIPEPHSDMPEGVRADYLEAFRVFTTSSRGAAALLRLAIQKLCRELGEAGKHIDTDIASLVKKGLPQHIQQALDIVRVIGNFAVHPGELDVGDNPESARQLFGLINEIIEDRIGKVKRLDGIKAAYDALPKSKLDAIEKRDK